MSGLEPLVAAAAIATIAGTAVTVGSTIFAGSKQREADYITADQLAATGREEFAAAQREAGERKLELALLQSKQQAQAAASGGGAGADAPTIVKIMTDTAARGQYGVDSTMFVGETTKSQYYRAADAKRRGGDNSFLGSILTGIGQGVSGVGRAAGMAA